jgi:hypothetical protein
VTFLKRNANDNKYMKKCSISLAFVLCVGGQNGKWTKLEITMLSEISQIQKEKVHIFSHMQNLDKKKNIPKVEGELFEKKKGTSGRGEGEQER